MTTSQPLESEVLPDLDGVPEETDEPLDADVLHEAPHEEIEALLAEEKE